jgi:hypothetical protein
MSRKFLSLINVTHLVTAPSNPDIGDMYFNTIDDALYFWNGTRWVVSSGSGGGTGYTSDLDGGDASQPIIYEAELTNAITAIYDGGELV